MAKKKQTKKEGSGFGKYVLGAALVGAAATGLFLYGERGKDNRQKVRAWTIKAKADVLAEFEKMKEVSEESYIKAIDKVMKRYEKVSDVGEKEAGKLSRELKRHWKEIESAYAEEGAPVSTAKKTVKKVTKKASTKSTPKKEVKKDA